MLSDLFLLGNNQFVFDVSLKYPHKVSFDILKQLQIAMSNKPPPFSN